MKEQNDKVELARGICLAYLERYGCLLDLNSFHDYLELNASKDTKLIKYIKDIRDIMNNALEVLEE